MCVGAQRLTQGTATVLNQFEIQTAYCEKWRRDHDTARINNATCTTQMLNMIDSASDSVTVGDAGKVDGITEVRRQEALLKTGALQNAILTSANFSIIATDEKGIIQLFNVGAERMLGYLAAEVDAQLMESASPAPTIPQKRSIDQILQAGWYLLELINEILDLALIESGKLSLSLEPISLEEVMHECQAMIEPQAQKRGISVVFSRFETPCVVKADRTRRAERSSLSTIQVPRRRAPRGAGSHPDGHQSAGHQRYQSAENPR
jgi:signal transduction histidine kinase